ncbi:MAG: LamG-like jellyroll fold domain-containing protein [Terracidiphilus sp.]
MKIHTSLVLVMPLFCLGATAQTVSIPSPVGWWQFDASTGTTAVDSSGNGHTATLANGVSWTTGKSGNAVVADGTDQYVSIPAIDLSATPAITWMAWINRTYSSSGGHVLFEDSANFNSSETGFGFFPDGDPGSNCLGLVAGIHGNVGYTISCYVQPTSNVWHHIAVVLDKSQPGSQAVSLYLDGQQQAAAGQAYTATNTNTFGNNPLYLFSRGGTTAFTAGTIDDLRLYPQALSASQIQQIYQQDIAPLLSLSVTPANPSLFSGSMQQFDALGMYSDGSTQDLTTSVAWTSSNTSAATITGSGLATAIAAGGTTIQASTGAIVATTALTVNTPVLVSVAVSPASFTTTVGGSLQFTVTGTYNNGATQNLTSSATWSSANPSIVSVSASGSVTGVTAGNTIIQATFGSLTATASIAVTSASLQSIAITPTKAQVAAASTLQLTATGTYSDGSAQDLTNLVAWSTDNTAIASVSSVGMVTGIETGTTTLRATINSVSTSTSLIVTPSGLVGWWNFTEGSGTTASDSSGNGYSATLYNGVNWTSGQTGGAISANGVNQYMATPPIDLSSTSAFTLAAWISRTWSSSGPTVLAEASPNFNGVSDGFGLFADDGSDCGISSAIFTGMRGNSGYALNCYPSPSSADWHHLAIVCDKSKPGSQQVSLYIDGVMQTAVASPYITTNSNTFGNEPFYFFSRDGAQFFTAGMIGDLRLYNRALSASEIGQIFGLAVTNAVLQSLAVTPANSSISPGNSQQFTSTGTYTDSSTRDLSGSVTWTSSNTGVASITSSGLATGISSGSTTIGAASGSISASAKLTVASSPQTKAQFVQWTAGDGGAATSEKTYLPNIVTTGNLILVFSHWDNQSATATVTDQLGNTYLPMFPPTNSGPNDRFQAWYAKNIVGGGQLGITITFSGKTNSISLLDAVEYSGLDPNTPLDGFASGTGNGLSQSSGSISVPNANSDIVIGFFGYSGYALPYTAGSGFTMRGFDATSMLEDLSATTSGTYTATATSQNSAYWAAFIIAFKDAVQ